MIACTSSKQLSILSKALSNRPDLYVSVDDMNSYSNPNWSRKARSRALLCSAKLAYWPNGSGTCDSGLPRGGAIMSRVGIYTGILRRPSMSSEKAISLVLTLAPASTRKACLTMLVRATSPKVPRCGRPDGPYPVSKITSLRSERSSRAINFRASSKGHAFDVCAASAKACGDILSIRADAGRKEGAVEAESTRPPRRPERAKLIAAFGGLPEFAAVDFYHGQSSPSNAAVTPGQASPPKSPHSPEDSRRGIAEARLPLHLSGGTWRRLPRARELSKRPIAQGCR